MEEKRYCFGCMKPLGWDGKCHSCDFEQTAYQMKKHHLPLGSTLNNGEYLVGRVLGEGGFGITYIGLHTTLQIPVAIKEYFPGGMVWRKCDSDKESYRAEAISTEAEELFRQGKTDFLREARVLSKFGSLDGIVRTRSFFEENETAYLVMDYIEGESVKSYVSANGRLRPELCWQILREPIRALMKLHEDGLVHQDISPDNIIINLSGRGTLIDFGAVRHANAIDDKTRTAIYKQGFSAYEQLEKRGGRGPWTDVYGLCATIYYMLTGQRPLDATERVFTDQLVPLSAYHLGLDERVEQLIMEGLVVETSGRLQRLDELYNVLYPEKMILPEGRNTVEKKTEQEKKRGVDRSQGLTIKMERKLGGLDSRRRRQKIVLGTGTVLFFALILTLGKVTGYYSENAKDPQKVMPAVVATDDKEKEAVKEKNTASRTPASEASLEPPVTAQKNKAVSAAKAVTKKEKKNKNSAGKGKANKQQSSKSKSEKSTTSQSKASRVQQAKPTIKPVSTIKKEDRSNKTVGKSKKKTGTSKAQQGQKKKTQSQKKKVNENTGVEMDGDLDEYLSE